MSKEGTVPVLRKAVLKEPLIFPWTLQKFSVENAMEGVSHRGSKPERFTVLLLGRADYPSLSHGSLVCLSYTRTRLLCPPEASALLDNSACPCVSHHVCIRGQGCFFSDDKLSNIFLWPAAVQPLRREIFKGFPSEFIVLIYTIANCNKRK